MLNLCWHLYAWYMLPQLQRALHVLHETALSMAWRGMLPNTQQVLCANTLRRSDERSRVHASSLRLMALTFMAQL